MAQASIAQREPSMEEILASIRRIIEDSDVEKRREAEDTAMAVPANDVTDALKGAEEFRAEFEEVAVADIPVAVDSSGVQPFPVDGSVAIARVYPEDSAAAAPEPDMRAESADEELAQAAPELEAALGAELEGVAELTPPSRTAETESAPAAPVGAVADAPARAPLISEIAGRQVAAAFGELEAFAASRRRSFDEMAEEMLRPMLQEWLDNNLPHLVERLVREEIERIARG